MLSEGSFDLFREEMNLCGLPSLARLRLGNDVSAWPCVCACMCVFRVCVRVCVPCVCALMHTRVHTHVTVLFLQFCLFNPVTFLSHVGVHFGLSAGLFPGFIV